VDITILDGGHISKQLVVTNCFIGAVSFEELFL